MEDPNGWLDEVKWDASGLVPAIAQHHTTGRILMMAWMNREALSLTVQTAMAHYWSRSRHTLWKKGETSGHLQRVHGLWLDCDGDAIVLSVDPMGQVACHTGRQSCFYRRWQRGKWVVVDPVLEAPVS